MNFQMKYYYASASHSPSRFCADMYDGEFVNGVKEGRSATQMYEDGSKYQVLFLEININLYSSVPLLHL